MEQLITYEEPKVLAIKIKNISYGIYSIILNREALISVSCETEEDMVISWNFKLQGEDYLNWKDDQYIIDYINNMINKMIA
jgi:hypothetical protein